ncbi:short chain dehydrogenase/reductase [Talaromyces proteolyticus]|uniref:Short chain dehydrogenase/reductase n=1 Tax=Talaromyces proteolyticus TaxID=1131652 RepID=A0AAD4KS45_9EURO|nr:short chain dehydrogenase/reductase [Talaromyces proteolyticus]KAH8699140.1 short chain dehydrogenase/reductase [Talaromyces proteolyticus]
MTYALRGRQVLITGGSRGLGALVAERFAAEGCNVAINYLSSKLVAEELAEKLRKKYNITACSIQGDTALQSDCKKLISECTQKLGNVDIVISNAGWTKFTDFGDLYAMTEEEWDKCWAVNVKGHFHLLRDAMPRFEENADGGVFLITSSIAGKYPSGSSLPYATTKAAAIHMMKGIAMTKGPKLRINAVCPGVLLTDWGRQFSDEYLEGIKDKSALKKLADIEDVADLYISLSKNKSITGSAVGIDSGRYIF